MITRSKNPSPGAIPPNSDKPAPIIIQIKRLPNRSAEYVSSQGIGEDEAITLKIPKSHTLPPK